MEGQLPTGPSLACFIDTDIGCDDAVAIAWLLAQPTVQVVGFSTVFGNSSVGNTSANLLALLDLLGRDIPVTMGAAAPLVYPPTSSGALVHGPDGLWGAQPPRDLSGLPQDAPAAIAAAARANPGLTIIALGPLTNIAQAVARYPDDLAGVRLVALGGAIRGGNVTPVAEFNIFADPHALAAVLESRMRVELVTTDAFERLIVDAARLSAQLAQSGGPAGPLLAHALGGYMMAATRGAGGPMPIPDAAAVIYAVRPDLGTATPAALRVVLDGELTRGQTIAAMTLNHQIALGLGASGIARLAEELAAGADLNAALGEALQRASINAQLIMQIDAPAMAALLEAGLLASTHEIAVGG